MSTEKLPRAQRREQILNAAIDTFAEFGYSAASLESVAEAAGVSRVILYRHFESKADLFRAVLECSGRRLAEASGPGLTESTIESMLDWAARNPAGFRVLFHHAGREPEFQADIDTLREEMTGVVYRRLATEIPDERWARWASRLSLTVTVDAVLTWLDVGRPDPGRAAEHIDRTVQALIESVQQG